MKQEDNRIIRNLFDAGCTEEMISAFMECRKAGNDEDGLRILRHQRECLLDEVHLGEKKISCLDYLIYQVKQMTAKERNGV